MPAWLIPSFYFLGIAGCFALLALLAVFGHFSYDALGALVLSLLGGLIRHVMPEGAPSPRQGGFASVRLLVALAFLVSFVLCLSACAPMATSWYAGAEAKVKADVQRTDDNVVTTLRDAWCGLPYGAIVRNGPKVADTVQALCGPLPSSLSAADLLGLTNALRAMQPAR